MVLPLSMRYLFLKLLYLLTENWKENHLKYIAKYIAIDTTRNFLRIAFRLAMGIRGIGATTALTLGIFYIVSGLIVLIERTDDNLGALVIGSGSVSTAQFSVMTGLYFLVYVGIQLC